MNPPVALRLGFGTPPTALPQTDVLACDAFSVRNGHDILLCSPGHNELMIGKGTARVEIAAASHGGATSRVSGNPRAYCSGDGSARRGEATDEVRSRPSRPSLGRQSGRADNPSPPSPCQGKGDSTSRPGRSSCFGVQRLSPAIVARLTCESEARGAATLPLESSHRSYRRRRKGTHSTDRIRRAQQDIHDREVAGALTRCLPRCHLSAENAPICRPLRVLHRPSRKFAPSGA